MHGSCGARLRYRSGYTGWVIRVGNTGVLPSYRAEPKEHPTSEAGPGSPQWGLEWVGGVWEGDPFA